MVIARRRGGSSVARLYYEECFTLLEDDYTDLPAQRKQAEAGLANAEMTLECTVDIVKETSSDERSWPGDVPGLRRDVEVGRRKLMQFQETENFIAVVRELATNPFP